MIRAAAIAIAVAVVVGIAAPVHADDRASGAPAATKVRKPLPPYKPGKPDRWAVHGAAEANLEGTGIRSGFAFVAGFAPALQIGLSVPKDKHATGTGGSFSFRVGRFANRDTIITVELCGTVFPYRFEIDPDATGPMPSETHTKIQQSALFAFGAQTYVAPTFWIRIAAGLASFTSRADGAQLRDVDNNFGGGAVAGAGLEIIRRRSVSFAVELMTTGAIYRDGIILGGGLGLSLGIY